MITSCVSRKSLHRSRLRLGCLGKTCARTSSRPLRFEKKVTVNGAITLHHHYLYRGYLQIVALDKKRANLQDLWLLHWDPNEPVATRPLSIRINATWFTYGYDLTKNVQEIFNTSGGIATSYDYTPFGAVSVEGTLKQPIQWSSEAYDTELALTSYNYRHYNPMDGRWINRDPINEQGGANLYGFVGNGAVFGIDLKGFQMIFPIHSATGVPGANYAAKELCKEWIDYTNNTAEGMLLVSQINFGGQGDQSMDLTNWLQNRFPNNIKEANQKISESIESRVKKLCFNGAPKISEESLNKIRYRIRVEDVEKDGGYSFCEKYFILGDFSLRVKNVNIKWDKKDCSYKWKGTVYALENAGATDPSDSNSHCYDYVYYYTPFLFKGRDIEFANYEIEGSGSCEIK